MDLNGDIGMDTVFNTTIPDNTICEYIDFLINKVYSLLPMFEESNISEEKYTSFVIFQNNLIQTINGNISLIKYNSHLVLDILSHLQSLLVVSDHDDYKRHVFKVCKLLSLLKKEVDNNGI